MTQSDQTQTITQNTPQEILNSAEWVQDIYRQLPPLAGYDAIGAVSGMHRGSIANFHSAGCGPASGMLIGKKRVFPRLEVCKWLIEMAEAKEAA